MMSLHGDESSVPGGGLGGGLRTDEGGRSSPSSPSSSLLPPLLEDLESMRRRSMDEAHIQREGKMIRHRSRMKRRWRRGSEDLGGSPPSSSTSSSSAPNRGELFKLEASFLPQTCRPQFSWRPMAPPRAGALTPCPSWNWLLSGMSPFWSRIRCQVWRVKLMCKTL